MSNQAGRYLSTHVSQRLRAFVFLSDHRTYSVALLQKQFDDRAPYRTYTTGRAVDQNGIRHDLPLMLTHLRLEVVTRCFGDKRPVPVVNF